MSRQELICNKSFSPTKIFNYLDIRNRGYLNPRDIRLFLEKNAVFVTKSEAELLFNSLDLDLDGKIDWNEFTDSVLSNDYDYDDSLDRDKLIGGEIQEEIVNIFMNELEGLKIVEKYKHNVLDLECDQFNLDNLFDELDTISKGFMDVRDIYDFLKAHSSSVAYVRAERVLRRLDGDADGKINFDDWINGLIPESKDPAKYSVINSQNSQRSWASGENTLDDTKVADEHLKTLELAKSKIAMRNIRKLNAIGSMSSMAPENLGTIQGPKSSIPGLKDINISTQLNRFGPVGTSKKNHHSLVGGLKKHDVDNQMTERGKDPSLNPYTKLDNGIKIEKFTNRLAVNGQPALNQSLK